MHLDNDIPVCLPNERNLNVHELLTLCEAKGLALNDTLTLMLGEHFSHQSERRGCGFTQASRLLADHINRASVAGDDFDFNLFANPRQVKSMLARSQIDAQTATLAAITRPICIFEQLITQCEREESKLFLRLLRDIVLRPENLDAGAPLAVALAPIASEKLKIGTCPLAEQFFLEIAHNFIRRIGQVNVIHDQDQPILIEKIGLGDNHSCISVAPVRINSVVLPLGTLIGVDYDAQHPTQAPKTRSGRGEWVAMHSVARFRCLRLTTLCISTVNRKRAFSTHFEQQIRSGLFSPDSTQIEQLIEYARAQRP